MSDYHGSESSAPLTRRELREREQAAQAARASESHEAQRAAERRATLDRLAKERSTQGSAPRPASTAARAQSPQPTRSAPPAPQSAYPAPAGQQGPTHPAPPAPAQATSPARRTTRPEGHTSVTRAPVVRPPAGAAGTRSVDATGRMSPVQPVGQPAPQPSQPPQAQVAPTPRPTGPERTSMRSAPGKAAPSGYGTTPAPADRDAGRPALSRTEGAASPWASTAGGSAVSRQSATRRPSAGAVSPAPPQAWAPPPEAQSSWGTSVSQHGAPGNLQNIGEDPQATVAAPAWASDSAVVPSFAPASAAFATDQDASSGLGWDAVAGPVGAQDARGTEAFVDDEYEMEEEAPRHRYTWLHYIILVAVAFVLGLLIWELVLSGDTGNAAASGADHLSRITTLIGDSR